MRAASRILAFVVAPVLAGTLAGCGTTFKLPTENINPAIPSDKSYQMIATWTGMDGVNDILLTQTGSQLFILFNRGPGVGPASRGEVRAYPLSRPTPIAGIDFPGLFNPVALCAGGASVFVLDQGDTTLARANPAVPDSITDIDLYWKVREYGLLGGDTLSAFTDTSVAFVQGIAADAQGRVYLSGTAVILEPDQDNPRLRTRKFVSVVYRYVRGPDGTNVYMLGNQRWHRDATWSIEQGTGFGNVVDARGMHWSPYGGGGLYVAVFGRNYAQRFSDAISNGGDAPAMASADDLPIERPLDVYADLQGFVYAVDEGNQRVLRYDPDKQYVQRVDLEPDAQGFRVLDPVAVAADDSLAYIADRGLGKVIRYKRRK